MKVTESGARTSAISFSMTIMCSDCMCFWLVFGCIYFRLFRYLQDVSKHQSVQEYLTREDWFYSIGLKPEPEVDVQTEMRLSL